MSMSEEVYKIRSLLRFAGMIADGEGKLDEDKVRFRGGGHGELHKIKVRYKNRIDFMSTKPYHRMLVCVTPRRA